MKELYFQGKTGRLRDGSLVVTYKITGTIDNHTVREFEDRLIGFSPEPIRYQVLILSGVVDINSVGIALLAKLSDRLILVGLPKKVLVIFERLELLSIFKIYETEEDATEAFGITKDPRYRASW